MNRLPDAAAQAARLLDEAASASDAAVAALPGDTLLPLGWALKDICYACWGSDPPRAAAAAQMLQAVHTQRGVTLPPAQAQELAGLAHWTAGITLLNKGQMAEAVRDFDAAAQALRAAGQPDPAAQTQVPKIMALSMLGRHDEATACAEAAQRELRALGNVGAAARVSQNLGNLLGRRDAYPDAVRHFREAAVLFARLGEHEHSIYADIGMAWSLASMGDFDEALRVCARAQMRAGNRGLARPLALIDEHVALVELARGRYREALASLESARRRFEQLDVPQNLAIAEKQLADAYLELRLLPEALALFDAAVAKFQALDLPDEQAWALAQAGRTQALLARPSAAAASFDAARQLFQTQGNAVGAAWVALARAELALTRREAAVALAWSDQAARAFTAAARADGQARAAVLQAEALLLDGQLQRAAAGFDSALAQARERQQQQLQVRCLTGQGLVHHARGDDAAARAAFEAAIERFEDQRRALPGDELRSAFISDHLRPYQELLRMAVQAGDAEQTLLQLDRCRARSLSERLDDDEPDGTDGHDATQRELRDRLNWLYRRLQKSHEEAGPSAALNDEVLRTEHQLLETARRRRLAQPAARAGLAAGADVSSAGLAAGADVSPAGQPAGADFSPAALQAALQPGDALVANGEIDDELFACVVTPQGIRLQRRLCGWTEVVAAMDAARFQIETLRNGAEPVRRHVAALTARAQARLQRLHAMVWAPLDGPLDGCRRVIVVPHGALGSLPFAALAGADGAPPLGERCALALAPSARTALRGLRRPAEPARSVLALGESSRLPHAAREAQAVAALFPQGRAHVGAAATLAALRAEAPACDVLHLACHAQFRTDNPRFSALHLADAALTVDEAETLGLRACTVVLSACETALAEQGGGDERVGLVRAFMVAGAARVLASLWPVDDEVTAAFMAHFYGALLEGMGPAQALGRAQAAVRVQFAHPYFWGAFTLYGAW